MLSKSQVKYIQSLGQKKFRDLESAFIAEGPKLVDELLKLENLKIINIYALQNWIDLNEKYKTKVNITAISEIELSKISALKTPNEVLAVVKKNEVALNPVLKDKVSLALDSIRDPGNLGTIIRIADWFGVKNIICSNDCADCYNSKVIQATMGSIGRVNIIYDNLEKRLKQYADIEIFAADLEGEDVRSMERLKNCIIVIGNEANGISTGIEKLITGKITITRVGKAESLNAAVATAIILSHLA